jgi:hypothetical protein
MSSFYEKLGISAFSAIIFALINLPASYGLSSKYVRQDIIDLSGCPTSKGILIHTIVFLVLSFLMMGNPLKEPLIKLKYSIYGALLFFLFSSPVMYSVTSALTDGLTASENGCQTNMGVIIHAIIYSFALIGMTYLPSGELRAEEVEMTEQPY